MENRRKLRS